MAYQKNQQKPYRTMQGKMIDMDLLRKKNELTPAVGNAKVNARGDELGAGGKIVKKREDVVGEYYKSTRPVTKEKPATKKEQAMPEQELTENEKELFEDFDDEWVEDEDGNFVKKGE